MAAPGGFSYKPNVNRTVTKKWKEANQVSYGGDEWGDEDEYGYEEPAPVSAGNARHPGWQGQGQHYPSNCSATNPSPSRSAGRSSFDRGDERRNFSAAGTGGFDSAYPTAQRNPFPEIEYDYEQQPQYLRHTPPLALHTQGQGPYPQPGLRPSSRGQQQRSYAEGPFSAPGAYPHSRSESGNRPGPPDMYQRRESPVRRDSGSSNASGRHFPPRKSSLSQAQPPTDIPGIAASAVDPAQSAPSGEEKSAPAFIRPADIYRRIEEEREKERRSQESLRPSVDLNRPKTRDSSTSARSTTSDTREPIAAPAEDSDSTRRLKPTLDTVVERKSEYGFDNMLKAADPDHPSVQSENVPQSATSDGMHRHVTNASSVYTDRPDPVSASSVSRNQSLREYPEKEEPVSSKSQRYNLPSIDRMSSFGTDLTSLTPSAIQGQKAAPITSAPDDTPPSVPAKYGNSNQIEAQQKSLGHHPSLGYRSVVRQAFDESQTSNPLSPTSGSDTIPRSNSASTSDISPIMGKRTEQTSGASGPPVTEQTIPEEPASPDHRPMSNPTVTPRSVARQERPLPAPPAIQVGYRRDVKPPSRDNSPARRPLSVETSSAFKSQRAMVDPPANESATANILAAADEVDERRRPGQSAGPVSVLATGNEGSLAASPLNARTTSEEYEDWRNEGKQFKSRFGIQDSNPTTPGAPSPVLRADSPPKGTVKDSRERLESQSGRSTPENASLEARPGHQPRMESFRPTIPGAWQSYTETPGAGTPAREDTNPLKPPTRLTNTRYDSSDSIPTARAPRNWDQDHNGNSSQAFAAAAAAGTALAGIFSGPALTQDTTDESQDSSDDEWNRSPVSRSPEHRPFDTRDFAVQQPGDHLEPHAQTGGSKPPTPLPKDTPGVEHAPFAHPESAGKDTLADVEGSSAAEDYFPAPLRTSRSIDPKAGVRPPMPNAAVLDDSPHAKNNDLLQQEIVKSLTPKSSNFESQPEHLAATKVSTGEDDLYGSGPASPMPSAGVSVAHASLPLHQTQPSISTVSTASPQKPMFPHRFSWETDPALAGGAAPSTPPTAAKSPSMKSPDTIRGPSRQLSNVISSSSNEHDPHSLITSGHRPQPSTEDTTSNLVSRPVTNTAGGPQGATLRKIMNIGNHHARMDAYTQNRELYAQSDGQLDQWITSMKDEHADVFSGRSRPPIATPTKPSPNRPLPNIGGGKIMPEDGKRLMAAAGRFGGKAGGAAKGFFAKGKEKLRQASAGDKGLKTSRRKSAGPSLLEPDDTRAPSRNSVLLTAPPQIPAQEFSSSPIDADNWSLTANREVDSTTRSVMKPVSTNQTRSVEPLSIQSTREDRATADPDHPGVESELPKAHLVESAQQPLVSRQTTLNKATTVPVIASALQDIPSEPQSKPDQGPPSQLDRNAEATAEHDDGYGQVASYMPPSQRASRTVSNAPPNLSQKPADPLAESENLIHQPSTAPTRGLTVPDDGLTVPDDGLTVPNEGRRRSVVSDVSSASPSPAKEQDGSNLDRSVSPPAEEHESTDETIPTYDASAPNLSKEQEAMRDRVAAADQNLDDSLPSYDEQDLGQRESREPRIAPGAQIVPVADLSQHKRMDLNRTSARPFSFDGSEVLNQALQLPPHAGHPDQLHHVPSLPLSPVSQTLSKSMSQVSGEEVSEGPNDIVKKQSRSYSRPFGGDPARDHPALRPATESVDRSQMYSTESPLPSARRPQPDYTRPRVQSPPVIEAEEEGERYRIPGPYRQEYRSPRQNSTPTPQAPSQPMNHAPPAPYPQAQAQPYQPPYQEQPLGVKQQPMSPPLPPEASRAKKSGFGGLFGNRSGSRSRRGKQGEPDVDQRNVLRRNSRQNSLASQQSSMNEARDVVGQLPTSDRKQRRFSRDLMRAGTATSTSVEQGEGKKKRFSAMGNLFSRGSKGEKSAPPQRSSTLPHNASQPAKNKTLPPDQQQMYRDPMGASGPQFHGSPPPVGGYYAPEPEQNHHWDPYAQNYPQGQMDQQYQQRPADLRIDTSSGGQSSQYVSASAPPQTRASRDISYQSFPYVPPNARPPSAEPVNIPRGPSPRVVDLHKRSRSPKLGRQSEDEEHVTREHAGDNLGTPVGTLGTFSNKKISPVGGIPRADEDQEAPYRIALPGESSEDKRRTRQLMIEQGKIKDRNRAGVGGPVNAVAANIPAQTVAERMAGPQIPGQNGPGRTAAARAQRPGSSSRKGAGFVAELPGSKAEGYESEEDVQMSATAYPGQWQDPIYFDGGRWDD